MNVEWKKQLDRHTIKPVVIDEFLCMVAGCVLGTDVCHWMFKRKGQRNGLVRE